MVEVQKPGGHLHTVSLEILQVAGFATDARQAPVRKGENVWTLPASQANGVPEQINVREGRLSVAIDNVNAGYADMAIVSTDAIAKWNEAKKLTCLRQAYQLPMLKMLAQLFCMKLGVNLFLPKDKSPGFTKVAELGPAGGRYMMQVSKEAVAEDRGWKDLILRDKATIITSDRAKLMAFLKAEGVSGVPFDQIQEREGGTEHTARSAMERSPEGQNGRQAVIFDFVSSGGSAFDEGFVPVAADAKWENAVLIRSNIGGERGKELAAACGMILDRLTPIRQAAAKVYLKILEDAASKRADTPAASFIGVITSEVRAQLACYTAG